MPSKFLDLEQWTGESGEMEGRGGEAERRWDEGGRREEWGEEGKPDKEKDLSPHRERDRCHLLTKKRTATPLER